MTTPSPPGTAPTAVRAVVMATDLAGDTLPLPPRTPVALLPVGHQTVLEHLLEQLADAGVRDVDLVACEQPEALRERAGDGARWGLRLRWQLVKDPARPYAALAAAARGTEGRVLVLHTDRLPDAAGLDRLLQVDHLEWLMNGLQWSGWASAPAAALRKLPGSLDRDGLAEALRQDGLSPWPAASGDVVTLDQAAGLFEAHARALDDEGLQRIPASWIRTPWGAMSPQARVEPGARITGPVLVGPGCWVARGASVGPQVVLSRHVVVSAGTSVSHSLLLPDTYLGEGLDVTQSLVAGTRLRHLGLDVTIELPAADALVLDLASSRRRGPRLAGRVAAAAALLPLAPVLAMHHAVRRLTGRPPAWTRRAVVVGREGPGHPPRLGLLRAAAPQAAAGERRWAALAGLIDVAAGRRCWFGMRLRSQGQWYALPTAWQDILAAEAPGLLHAPAWQEGGRDTELEAAADVFAARTTGWARWRLLGQALRPRGPAGPAGPARDPAPQT